LTITSLPAPRAPSLPLDLRPQVFQEALGEIMLFKSRADVALLQATDQASRIAAEAEETERRYHAHYLGAGPGGAWRLGGGVGCRQREGLVGGAGGPRRTCHRRQRTSAGRSLVLPRSRAPARLPPGPAPRRAAAQGQFKESEEARKELQAALARKQEAASKLQLLQQEIAMLANMNPQEMAALQVRGVFCGWCGVVRCGVVWCGVVWCGVVWCVVRGRHVRAQLPHALQAAACARFAQLPATPPSSPLPASPKTNTRPFP
jgi:hypothetical protein